LIAKAPPICRSKIVAAPWRLARSRKDRRGVDLISDALPFGWLWYARPNAIENAIGYAKFYSRSRNVVIRVCNEALNLIETHDHAGDFKEW
jgi:hypothetical protein